MRALLVLAAAVMLACCATSREEDARVCDVARAIQGYPTELADTFDQSNWQSISVQPNRSNCVETQPPSGLRHRYSQVGMSDDGHFAKVNMLTDAGNAWLEEWSCYLQRDDQHWELTGCIKLGEF